MLFRSIEPADALVLLQDPETQAHLTRLNTVNRSAEPLMDHRELLEEHLIMARMTKEEFLLLSERMPGKGQQRLGDYWSMKLAALDQVKKMLYPSPDALLKRARKLAKNRGEPFDVAAAVKDIRALINGKDSQEGQLGKAQP